MSDDINKQIEYLSKSISGQMDAHLIESIISLFNAGVLVHYIGSPKSTFDPGNCKMTVEAANGVKFEGREKLINLQKENEKLKNVCLDLLAIEESYEILDELGDNFYEYIDGVRPFLETLKTRKE